jgi:hypothetical protein
MKRAAPRMRNVAVLSGVLIGKAAALNKLKVEK